VGDEIAGVAETGVDGDDPEHATSSARRARSM
jgi:hypothetical protein